LEIVPNQNVKVQTNCKEKMYTKFYIIKEVPCGVWRRLPERKEWSH